MSSVYINKDRQTASIIMTSEAGGYCIAVILLDDGRINTMGWAQFISEFSGLTRASYETHNNARINSYQL